MEIRITSEPIQIEEVSQNEFNVKEINKIKDVKGGAVRQNSKAPTFSVDLRGYLSRNDDQPWMARRKVKSNREKLP